MKLFFTLGLFLICALSNAQEKKGGFFSIALGINIPTVQNSDPAIGGHLSGNGQLGKGAYAGLEVGVVKFQELKGVYIPIQARFTLVPGKDPSKVSPMVILAPGIGAYNKTSFGITTTGGFVFYGGIGLKFPSKKKGGAFLTAGYSLFGFEVAEQSANMEMIGIRAGVMLN